MLRPLRRRPLFPSLALLAVFVFAAASLVWRRPAPAQEGGGGGSNVVVIRDAEAETLLRNFADPLFRAGGIDPGLVRIILIRDAAINSFVSTGNRMFINTGLIEQADSALELIGVMAHETGHVIGGHLSKLPEALDRAMYESLAAMLVGLAAGFAGRNTGGGDAAAGIALGGAQMAQRGMLSFSRTIEASADQAAMRVLDRVCWSAAGLLGLFHKLEGQEALVSDLQDPYVRTHPLTAERIASVQNHVATSPCSAHPLPAGWETDFQMVKAKLVGFLAEPGEVLRRYPETDRSAPARYARAIMLYRQGHTDLALALMRSLMAEQPANPWLFELEGQILFDGGRGREALGPYREAARLAPDQPLIGQELAHAEIETGDPALLRPAIARLQRALARERSDPFSWHELGVAWGRLGDMGQSNLALAEAALAERDIKNAKTLAARALAALPPGPARLRATDIANAVKPENRPQDQP
jgi:predicted Zn-dependent protease